VPTRRARPYHHGALREAVLDAARSIISRDGTTALTMRELARATGVTHGALYAHFADRNALLVELSIEALNSLTRTLHDAIDDTHAPLEAIERLSVRYVRFAVADPPRFRLAFTREFATKSAYPALRAAADAAEAPALAAVQRAAEAGLLPLALVREQTISLWALVHGYATLASDGLLQEGVLSIDGGALAEIEQQLRRAIRRSLVPTAPDERQRTSQITPPTSTATSPDPTAAAVLVNRESDGPRSKRTGATRSPVVSTTPRAKKPPTKRS
jgi:AcrR family transcriptional regulator